MNVKTGYETSIVLFSYKSSHETQSELTNA